MRKGEAVENITSFQKVRGSKPRNTEGGVLLVPFFCMTRSNKD